jgi:hypothetical protein
LKNLHEERAAALRQLANAHADIAGHHSAESRDALQLAQLHQRDPIALEHYALLAKSSGECSRLHRELAQFAAVAADKSEFMAKMERWGR